MFRNTHMGRCLPNRTLSERGPSAAFSATASYFERRAVSYPRPPMPNRPRSLLRAFSNHATAANASGSIAPVGRSGNCAPEEDRSADPTAIATLGLLSLAPRRAGTLPLIILPIIWCLASALTLRTMGASEGWIPLTAAALAVLAQAWLRRNGTCPNSDAAPNDQRRPVRGSADVGRSAHRL